jgi:hypothetical protein
MRSFEFLTEMYLRALELKEKQISTENGQFSFLKN